MGRKFLGELAYWINERWAIYQRKEEQKKPAPWSLDKIMQEYRFCNVHRENDRVTRWIKKNWRDPHQHDPHLWHRMLVARLFNWPPTLEFMGYPDPWNPMDLLQRLREYRGNGNKVFTGAYIVSTNGRPMDKLDYVLWVLDEAHTARPLRDSLAETHAQLIQLEAVGSFIAAQVVADLKHTPQLGIQKCPDWYDWAAPGPGSIRGLNRVLTGNPEGTNWRNPAFSQELMALREELEPLIEWVPDIDLQDLQNCLCEFDKYQRIAQGGKVRARYSAHSYEV